MPVQRHLQLVNVEFVGQAYDIAANYLKKTGAIADSGLINDRLLAIIQKRLQGGERNRLRLANFAISRFQRA